MGGDAKHSTIFRTIKGKGVTGPPRRGLGCRRIFINGHIELGSGYRGKVLEFGT